MACQKLFRTKYVDFLIDQVNKGIKLEQYYGFSFPYDERQVLSVPKILKPEGLIYKMNTEDNCASGIALFEAFPYLSALQAADNRLWIYLAVADLFSYVREKWAYTLPDINDKECIEDMKNNVRIHWFGLQKNGNTFNPMRHALANLWWSVFISVDNRAKNSTDKYRYTSLLFKNETFRTRTIGAGFLGRSREALYGIFDFMERCPELFDSKEAALNEITVFLNCLGSSIMLSSMKRDFFCETLFNNRELLKDRISERRGSKTIEAKPYAEQEGEDAHKEIVEDSGEIDYFDVRSKASLMINKADIK